MDELFWKLPYEWRRTFFKWQHPKAFQKLMDFRNKNPEKISGRTFKPFIENKCIFVHIPKVAGISVGYSLFGRHTGNHTTITDYQMVFSKNEFNRFYKFTFVRNPWDRLLSAFLFLKKGGRNKGDLEWAEKHLDEFDDFNAFVLNWVAKENVESAVHFKPQYIFITNPGSLEIRVDFIGRYENLAEDFNVLKQKLGFGDDLIFKNKTEEKTKDYRSFYNSKTKAIVAEVHKEDINLFGYKF